VSGLRDGDEFYLAMLQGHAEGGQAGRVHQHRGALRAYFSSLHRRITSLSPTLFTMTISEASRAALAAEKPIHEGGPADLTAETATALFSL
jgi:hypothetical protein